MSSAKNYSQLRTVDHSARRSMKNAANCAKHGELQGFMKPLHVERILRPRLPGRGHTHLRVERTYSSSERLSTGRRKGGLSIEFSGYLAGSREVGCTPSGGEPAPLLGRGTSACSRDVLEGPAPVCLSLAPCRRCPIPAAAFIVAAGVWGRLMSGNGSRGARLKGRIVWRRGWLRWADEGDLRAVSGRTSNLTSGWVRLPAEFKHIIERRK